MKNVVILGKGGYIAEKLYTWLNQYPESYNVQILSTIDGEWEDFDLSGFDVAVNCAGIAHINNITEDMKPLFYAVNGELPFRMGVKAKENGVKHFIQFSSMNVYGDYCECVTDREAEAPTSFYGDSKLQGDLALRTVESKEFFVAYVRPPFVYGKGCRGNYNTISKIAKKTPIFPTYKNKKSMIYIDNLCEFIRLTIDNRLCGVLTPQNKELVSTAELVKAISTANGKKIHFIGAFNWAVAVGKKLTRVVRRAFADDCYDMALSDYFDFKYCVVDFEESVIATEK